MATYVFGHCSNLKNSQKRFGTTDGVSKTCCGILSQLLQRVNDLPLWNNVQRQLNAAIVSVEGGEDDFMQLEFSNAEGDLVIRVSKIPDGGLAVDFHVNPKQDYCYDVFFEFFPVSVGTDVLRAKVKELVLTKLARLKTDTDMLRFIQDTAYDDARNARVRTVENNNAQQRLAGENAVLDAVGRKAWQFTPRKPFSHGHWAGVHQRTAR